MKISPKYKPLYELLNDKHENVDLVVMTGGRSSAKSFNAFLMMVIASLNYNKRAIALRFTQTSIKDSVRQNIEGKINILNATHKAEIKQNNVEFEGGGYISFKGIKTGSNNQESNLKSLEEFSLAIVDEADEIPDYNTYERFHLSLRGDKTRNIMVLILNPTSKNHWIYEKFFKERSVKDGSNLIKDNIMYIHTSYLDVSKNHIPKNILARYEWMRENNLEQYNHVVLGGWLDNTDEQVFPINSLKFYPHLPDKELIAKISFVDIADKGEDYHSAPIGYLYEDGRLFIEDVLFTQLPTSENTILTADIFNRHKVNYARIESNFGGSMYMQLIQDKLDVTELYDARATTNKHGRILTRQWDIKNNVYFRKDWGTFSDDYRKFMQNMFDYTKDGKATHDDAPDSLEGLITFVRTIYADLY